MGCGGSTPKEPLDYSTTTEHWHHVAGVKVGPCAHVPAGAEPGVAVEEDGVCDCFYVHGTSDFQLTGSNAKSIGDKAPAHTSALRRESTWANGCCKMYAPGYRQFTPATIIKIGMGFNCTNAIEFAQRDIDVAFTVFLDKYCTGSRPFILAGHSQGGMMIRHLIRSRVDKDPALRARLVCAYIAGAKVGHDTFTNVKLATGETDTGCVVTWATTLETKNKGLGSGAAWANVAGVEWTSKPVSINLLNWSTHDNEPASEADHVGCLDMQGNLTNMKVSVRCANDDATAKKGGVLLVSGKVPKGYVNEISESWDYHEGDIPCFWANLRANAIKRLEAYNSSMIK